MRISIWHRIVPGLVLFLVAPTVAANTPPPQISAHSSTEAFTAMVAAGEAYLNDATDCPGVISATNLYDSLGDFTVIDIRADFSYLAGHIPGAYPSSLATLLADVGTTIPTHKPLVIADYTGQTAGHAKIALELMGYEDTMALRYGMCSWNPSLSMPWDLNVGDNLGTPEVTNNNGELSPHPYPELMAGTAQAAGIHEVVWRGRDDAGRELASGTYFYRLDAGAVSKRSRMLLLK